MAVLGNNTAIYAAANDVTAQMREFSFGRMADPIDTTTYGATDKTFAPGLKQGKVLTFGGFWEGSTNGLDSQLQSLFGTADQPYTVLPLGDSLGNTAYIINADESSYALNGQVAGMVGVTVEVTPDGPVDRGVSVHPKAAETATGNSTAVDGGAATTTGWAASLHVFAKSGTTPTLNSKMQDSADNSTFADLAGAAFTQATVAGSQLITGTGTVRRYVREVHTIAGTGPSFTFACAFARR